MSSPTPSGSVPESASPSPAPTTPTGPAIQTGVPRGYTSLTPYLVVEGASAAIDFYTRIFGAKVVSRMDGPGRMVMHAELDFGNGRLQLSDPMPSYGLRAPHGEGVTGSIVHYVSDVDSVYAAAIAAGAKPFEPVSTFVTGDRFGSLLDPFGHRWAIMTRVEDVPSDVAEQRVKEWLASQSSEKKA